MDHRRKPSRKQEIIPVKSKKRRNNKDDQGITPPLALFFVTALLFVFVLNVKILYQGMVKAKDANPEKDPTVLTEVIETNYMENFAGRENYIGLNGALAKPLEQVELNEVLKLHNGYLTTLVEEVSNEDLTMYADHVLGLQDYLKESDIPFAFVLTPHKLPSDNDMMLPTGYDTYPNQNSDILLDKLDNLGVPTLDLREEIRKEGINHYDLFFRTDHHWSVYGGFWSHKYVAKTVDSLLGESHFNEFYADLDHYDHQVYENFWLGSHGKRTGEFFGGLDDLPVITPAFETDVHVVMEERDWDIRGSFAEAFLNAERLDVNPYGLYLTSDLETSITNHLAPNDTSIFIIKDSFALVMAPFLSLHYKDVYLFDLRLDSCTPADLVEALEEVDPDVVLCFYNPVLIYEKTFAFLPDQLREGTR